MHGQKIHKEDQVRRRLRVFLLAPPVPKKKTGIASSKESFRTQASPASERQSACLLVNDSKVTLRIHGYACNLAILGSFAMVFDVLGFCKLSDENTDQLVLESTLDREPARLAPLLFESKSQLAVESILL